MENGSVMRAFVEWEVIAACLFFMLLLPLIFFVASLNRRPRPRPRREHKRSSVPRGNPPQQSDAAQ